MKRIAIVLLVLAACRSAPSYGPGTNGTITNDRLTGAVSPRAAVEAFLGAVRAQDLKAMALVWGDTKGPARDVVDHTQLEKRELIMQCYLTHDKFQILSDARSQGGSHVLDVSLSKGPLTRQTTFTTVQGPEDRWYVQDLDLQPVRDLCASS